MVGYGGHAKSVADCIERDNQFHIVGYTELKPQESKYKYLGTDDSLRSIFESGVTNAAVCVGYLGKNSLRENIYEKLKEIGFLLPVISDPSSIVADSASIGEGTFVGKGVIINAEAKIGKMCIINTKALIEHECAVEDFSHIAVGAVLCGQVRVGKAAFIGANATVIQQMEIASRKCIPAGATIR